LHPFHLIQGAVQSVFDGRPAARKRAGQSVRGFSE